jgi:hypothetical protein
VSLVVGFEGRTPDWPPTSMRSLVPILGGARVLVTEPTKLWRDLGQTVLAGVVGVAGIPRIYHQGATC